MLRRNFNRVTAKPGLKLSRASIVSIVLFGLFVMADAQAAITFRSATSNGIATASSTITHVGAGGAQVLDGCGDINPGIPAGSVNDMLIALVITKEDDVGNAVAMPGWNTYYFAEYPGAPDNNELQVSIFWRLASGGDPNTITQSGGACTSFAGQIARFSGVDTSQPFETVTPGVVNQDSDNLDTGTITTTSATAMLLVAGFISDNRNVTEGAGWNQSFDFDYNGPANEGDLAITLNYQLQSTAGNKSISNWNFSGGGTDENFGVIFALRPSNGGLTINVPAGTTTDDVMIAVISVRPSTVTFTPPAGWTSLNRVNQGGGNSNAQEIYYRVATGSEPASYTWNFSAPITGAAGGIATYTGVDTSTPINVSGGNTTPNGTSHTANSVTTTVTNTMVISTHSFSSAETWDETQLPTMNERVDVASLTTPNGGGISLAAYDVIQPVAGATGNITAVANGNADTGSAQIVALTPILPPPTPLAEWRMDETSWNGTAGEVVDNTGNGYNGTAQNGAVTDKISPAVAGDPGTCGYGVFDGAGGGAGDYISLPGFPNQTSDFTVTAWIRTNDNTRAGQRIFADDESNTGGYALSVGDGGAGTLRFYSRNVNNIILDTGNVITNNTWYFIAGVVDITSSQRTIYVFNSGGTLVTSVSDTFTGTWGTDAGVASIGGETNSGETANRFFGNLDEVHFYDNDLSQSQLTAILGETHPCPATIPDAYYTMDESTWSGAGSILDASGNNNHGNPLGGVAPASPATNPAIAGDPGTCGYGDIPANTNNSIDAIDTNYIPGNQGAITFWYNSNENWTGGGTGDRLLFDASVNLGNNNADKHFFLVRRNNSGGALRFRVEDSNDTAMVADATGFNFPAGTWVHVAVTWDLPNDFMEIYVNGVSAATDNTNTNGTIGTAQDIYIGDNRDTGTGGGGWSNDSTDGFLDEFRIYSSVISATDVQNDFNSTHPCTGLDHYGISHDGTGVTCLSEQITITGHSDTHIAFDPGTVTINLATSTGKGDWPRVIAGTGALIDVTAGDGAATYTFPGGENSVTLAFNYTNVAGTSETFSINVDDGTATEATGSAVAADDPDLTFSLTGFQFYNYTAANETIPNQIAGKPSNAAPNNATLGLRAVRASDNDAAVCEAAFPDLSTVNIDLGAECLNLATCAGRQLQVTNNSATTAIATNDDNAANGTSAYTSVNLLFEDDGTLSGITRALLVLNYPDAGRMQLHARYEIPLDDGGAPPAGSTDFMTGSSQTFISYPFALAITDITAPGANPGSLTPANPRFTTAGTDFSATVGAYLWQQADDDGVPWGVANDGFPDFRAVGGIFESVDVTDNTALVGNALAPNFAWDGSLTAVLYAPAAAQGGVLGTLNNGSVIASDFSGGEATIPDLQYMEAGTILLLATFNNYLDPAIDLLGASAFNGTLDSNGIRSGAVGRFGADQFTFTVNAPELGPGCGNFTYVGQPFSYTTSPQITARATAADGVTVLSNYEDFTGSGGDNWWLLNFTPVGSGGGIDVTYSDLAGPTDISLDSSATTYTPDTGITGANGQQLFDLDGSLAYAKNAPPVSLQAPFDADLRLDFAVADTDGATGTHTINPITFNNPEQRWGRLAIANASGSELLSVVVPVTTEYWDGTAFATNGDDSCTVIEDLDTDISLTNPDTAAGVPQPGDTAMIIGDGTTQITSAAPAITSGMAQLVFSAPDDGDAIPDTGYVDIEIDLSLDSLADPGGSDDWWLQYDWDNDGDFAENPQGRATFGIYSGPQEFIYLREPW